MLLDNVKTPADVKKLNIKESTSASQYLRAKKLLKDKILNYINLNDL